MKAAGGVVAIGLYMGRSVESGFINAGEAIEGIVAEAARLNIAVRPRMRAFFESEAVEDLLRNATTSIAEGLGFDATRSLRAVVDLGDAGIETFVVEGGLEDGVAPLVHTTEEGPIEGVVAVGEVG